MPYIGRSTDGIGVRNRFLYLASASDTSVSGADANGATLTFTDGAYVDVYLNGVLLKAGTDYNTNTANTIAGLSAMASNDEVTVIVYDVFTVGDMVSATSGGTFSGAITFSSTVSGLDVNGTEIILDADGDTTITADTDDTIDIKIGGSDIFQMTASKLDLNGKELILDADADTSITADTDDQIDIKIAGADDFQFTANTFTAQSGSTIAAQALTATTITASDDVTFTGANYNVMWDKSANDLSFDDNAKLTFGASNDLSVYHDGSNTYIDESGTGALFIRSSRVSMHKYTGETLINATADGAVSLYYDDSKKLETVSSGLEVYNGSTGSSPELILKDMNSGVVADDVGGGLFFYTNDGNGQGSNLAIRQKYENSSGGAGMAFEVGTGSSRDERMRLNTSGQLIMRNASADANACITVRQSVGSGLGGIFIDTYAYYSNIPGINITNGDTNNARNMEDVEFHRNGSLQGYIRISHSSVSFTSSSDYRLKEDAKEITNAFEQIKKLKPYNFKWKQSGVRQDGFFAHEVGEVFDYVAEGEKDDTEVKKKVVRNKDGFVIAQNIEKADWEKRKADADNEEASPKGETTYPTDSTWQEEYEDIKPQTVDNSKLVPMLTACLQEAIAKIETLEAKVKALEEA